MTNFAFSRAGQTLALVGALVSAACGGENVNPATSSDPTLTVPSFPPESGSCTLTHDSGAPPTTVRWEQATRQFELASLFWRLDERGRVVEYGEADRSWRHLTTYDEHGEITRFVYEWKGVESTENSWDQENEYDERGRITRSTMTYRRGAVVRLEYIYETEGSVLVRRQWEGMDANSWSRTVFEGKRVVAVESGGGDDDINSRTTAFYDHRGRLVRMDTDGAGMAPRVDGKADLRREWDYDDENRCILHRYDGTEALDAPFVDGIPDGVTRFEPECAAIAVLPQRLYHFPHWFEAPETRARE